MSKLFRALGRNPRPTITLPPPPDARAEQVRYARQIIRFWNDWTRIVWTELRLPGSAPRFRARVDAADDPLHAKFSELVRNSGLSEFLEASAKRTDRKQSEYMRRVAKIATVPSGKAQTIEKFRNENLSLIQSLGEAQIEQLRGLLRESTETGGRVEILAADIQHTLGVGASRAQLIARDQTLKLNGQLAMAHQLAAGITEYDWDSSQDGVVRPMHRKLHGTRQRWDNPPITNEDGDRNHPGGDYQCRCVPAPVVALFEGI